MTSQVIIRNRKTIPLGIERPKSIGYPAFQKIIDYHKTQGWFSKSEIGEIAESRGAEPKLYALLYKYEDDFMREECMRLGLPLPADLSS